MQASCLVDGGYTKFVFFLTAICTYFNKFQTERQDLREHLGSIKSAIQSAQSSLALLNRELSEAERTAEVKTFNQEIDKLERKKNEIEEQIRVLEEEKMSLAGATDEEFFSDITQTMHPRPVWAIYDSWAPVFTFQSDENPPLVKIEKHPKTPSGEFFDETVTRLGEGAYEIKYRPGFDSWGKKVTAEAAGAGTVLGMGAVLAIPATAGAIVAGGAAAGAVTGITAVELGVTAAATVVTGITEGIGIIKGMEVAGKKVIRKARTALATARAGPTEVFEDCSTHIKLFVRRKDHPSTIARIEEIEIEQQMLKTAIEDEGSGLTVRIAGEKARRDNFISSLQQNKEMQIEQEQQKLSQLQGQQAKQTQQVTIHESEFDSHKEYCSLIVDIIENLELSTLSGSTTNRLFKRFIEIYN